jgi:hypothetical protein
MENKTGFDLSSLNAMEEFIKEQIAKDPDIAQALLAEDGVPIKTYRIDFGKVKTLPELLKILQHLSFVISGPQEYFDTYCKEIQEYLISTEEGS